MNCQRISTIILWPYQLMYSEGYDITVKSCDQFYKKHTHVNHSLPFASHSPLRCSSTPERWRLTIADVAPRNRPSSPPLGPDPRSTAPRGRGAHRRPPGVLGTLGAGPSRTACWLLPSRVPFLLKTHHSCLRLRISHPLLSPGSYSGKTSLKNKDTSVLRTFCCVPNMFP